MEKKQPLTDEETEDLVAYLDGELAGDDARAIEGRLSCDTTVRKEAEALQQAWDLLDYLPRPEVSPNFTHRTLDRVSALRPSTSAPAVPGRRHWPVILAWAAAVLLAALAGYALAPLLPSSWSPFGREAATQDAQLTRDLRLIENYRLYQQLEDPKFLHELDRPEMFGKDEDDR
jgi:anti-sigma factor RsiW